MTIDISINADNIELSEHDYELMWNLLMEDSMTFEYRIFEYLNNNIDNYGIYWKDESQVKTLYDNLKMLFEEE